MRETPEHYRRRHRATALAVLSLVALMAGMAYAAVPLYRAFCRATGYGGTPQVAAGSSHATGTRTLNVRFDANVAPGLPWTFEPEQGEVAVKTGTTTTVFYKVTSQADHPTSANALYNVSPDVSGFYFDKIACFCFDEQHLGPRETMELPVVFFLDPALERDKSMSGVDTLTLSYTLFAAKAAPAVAAALPSPGNRSAPVPKL